MVTPAFTRAPDQAIDEIVDALADLLLADFEQHPEPIADGDDDELAARARGTK